MVELRYIHDLPNRKTGFIRVGWWIIIEIMRARYFGIDWKKDYKKLQYSSDLYTLATMFEMYDDVEVQESLNGYILDKAQIESGYIYYDFDFLTYPTPHLPKDDEPTPPDPDPEPKDNMIYANPLVLIVM